MESVSGEGSVPPDHLLHRCAIAAAVMALGFGVGSAMFRDNWSGPPRAAHE
ncbi:hypothetical protein AB0B78_23185 [Streptomyces sp. NPDC040724]|uniref:hypothetical protein n=1 Tax=unclassified Streptomyces TaxID=2593676 RepID=UPI003411466F